MAVGKSSENKKSELLGPPLTSGVLPGKQSADGSSTKLAARVAERIENAVMRMDWPVGSIVGSEAELISQLGVSRAVFREGIRIVESHGVARMRRGPKGGLMVTAPDMASVRASAALWLDYAGVKQEDLFSVRMALEFTCLRQLSDNLTEEKIARLRSILDEERKKLDEEGLRPHRNDIHYLMAELTDNPALLLFVDVLTHLTHKHAMDQVPNDRETADEMHKAHTKIVDALISGDLGLAQYRLTRHLEAVAKFYR